MIRENENFLSVILDPQFFSLMNRAGVPHSLPPPLHFFRPVRPSTKAFSKKNAIFNLFLVKFMPIETKINVGLFIPET